ncbi:pilus assembly protein TadG-related protein [Streptomyces scopuliridis]|uniref:pilus assembly protein TadG-related protein n=1 Tax=Streptomyces scopuliridis TaxID=452529 RepID=UPI002DD908F2|nr:pilus assembly protein TadG-related protein [Streptomyces scopuliridis]WSB33711.1 pilus assembly protein TadG-related protein [Streptomyces scopuliridis]
MKRSGEAGQAAPIYITMVAGLLFLALALFTVGQAGAKHSGAQSAADAAALAAAQESRDDFVSVKVLENLLNPAFLDDIFNGDPMGTAVGCEAAERFADRNEAVLVTDERGEGCRAMEDRWGFKVHVETKKPMGATILPGTADKKAEAFATAIVEPRCTFKPAEDGENPPTDGEEPPPDGDNPGDTEQVSPGSLECGGTMWNIDPEHLDLLPDSADLFSVRLAQD